MARRQRKRANGTGDSITIFFDKDDREESAALAMSKLLARRHGKRKAAIVAALAALYQVYEETGEIPSANEIAGALSALSGGSRQPGIGFVAAVGQSLPDVPSSSRRDPVGVQIVNGGKASAKQSARNFVSSAASMGFFE